MSDIYYIGTFEENKINKPIVLTGSKKSVLYDLLEMKNVDMYDDFHYCCTDDRHDPLFYKVTEEYSYLKKDENSKDLWQEGIDLGKIKEFPLICDGIEKNNTSYHIILEKVFESNYKLNDKEITFIEVKEIFKKKDEYFVKSLMEEYEMIINWIKENKKIYFYKYA